MITLFLYFNIIPEVGRFSKVIAELIDSMK
jgi:hypothetical protein